MTWLRAPRRAVLPCLLASLLLSPALAAAALHRPARDAVADSLVAETPAPSPVSFGTIPVIDDNTLAGEHIRLPADLAAGGGHACVLILGFSRQARDPVRAWGKRLAQNPADANAPLFFEAPVLASVPRLLRGYVLRSIAAEVSERGRHHFLPITSDEKRWRTLAGYNDPDAAYLLVVDSTGQVRWRSSGPLTDAAYAELERHLRDASS